MMDKKTKQTKSVLNHLFIEWDHLLTCLANIKEEKNIKDLFSLLYFLSQLDEIQGRIFSYIPYLEGYMEESQQLQREHSSSAEQMQAIQNIKEESQTFLKQIKPMLSKTQETYQEVAEEILNRSEGKIIELTDKILEHRQMMESIEHQIQLELDEETQLRELRDSLETYREVRLENGREDPMLEKLDSQVMACEIALFIEESSG